MTRIYAYVDADKAGLIPDEEVDTANQYVEFHGNEMVDYSENRRTYTLNNGAYIE